MYISERRNLHLSSAHNSSSSARSKPPISRHPTCVLRSLSIKHAPKVFTLHERVFNYINMYIWIWFIYPFDLSLNHQTAQTYNSIIQPPLSFVSRIYGDCDQYPHADTQHASRNRLPPHLYCMTSNKCICSIVLRMIIALVICLCVSAYFFSLIYMALICVFALCLIVGN